MLMVVEVTSDDQDTERRDRQEKPRADAATRIPVYLLIDRDSCEITVHSDPNDARYQHVLTVPFYSKAPLPSPVDLELDTSPLAEAAAGAGGELLAKLDIDARMTPGRHVRDVL
ncbi:Uma2 family endonuclease [Nocardia seriolae]|nr:hypothetical protein NS14008_17585 [Nocardia seriolae]GEM28831.1 hypothetical protein NS2_70700 [Nocardia seriolae NBRC 15557]QUN17161.1 Uma2 family endonuclease [Nocardia seriolae]BAW07297.1 conserved hypothetical protein [Nocardia seriolae]BEK88089.1 hypothetical protein NSERKGN1266_40400 [Nocardia seriolae]